MAIAQEGHFRANPEKDTGTEKFISSSFSEEYMVVSADKRASLAARKVIEIGGNALDAVIAAQNVLSVVEPQSSGLGGGGFLLYFDKRKKNLLGWDGREFAPASAEAFMFSNNKNKKMKFLEAIRTKKSVGIPGLYNMLADAHKEYGLLDWEKLFEDSISYSSGFIISNRLSKLLKWAEHIQDDEYVKEIYFKKNKPKKNGEIVINKKLKESLKELSKNPYSLKKGKLSHLISQKLENTITSKDLQSWKTIKRTPICKLFLNHTICGFPPPTSGGVGVLQILGILEKVKKPDNLIMAKHYFLEASRLAYRDRDVFIADPNFFNVPVRALISSSYLYNRAKLIDSKKANPYYTHGNPTNKKQTNLIRGDSIEKPSTTHISVIDKFGNAAALTSSIEFAFGSGKTVGGFFLNNQLTDFSFLPVDESQKKIANSVSALKKPRSSMAPTIVLKNKELVGVLGSPGGSRIICYVARVLYYKIGLKKELSEVVSAPHICSRNEITEIEKRLDANNTADMLERYGHKIERRKMTSGINIIWKEEKGWHGVADPRREGVAISNEAERKK